MKKKTSDALKILDRRLFAKADAKRDARMEKYYRDMKVAEDLRELRTTAGLTQEQLANKVETSRSVIARLEDAEYRGHSVRMLEKIALALGHRVEIRFAPIIPLPKPVVLAKRRKPERAHA